MGLGESSPRMPIRWRGPTVESSAMHGRRTLDPYAVLGIPRSASPLQVARAHRHLAKRHHPDLHEGVEGSVERMRRINEAWAILSNPVARADRAAVSTPPATNVRIACANTA